MVKDKYFKFVEKNTYMYGAMSPDWVISHSTKVANNMEARGADEIALLAWTEVFIARAVKDEMSAKQNSSEQV